MLWLGVVPLWHFPDEQAHFAQVQNFAEFGKKHYRNEDGSASQEIAVSEELLGTLRNKQGNNRFTYHPEYNLFYTNTFTGKHEKEIKNFPQNFRKKMAIAETTSYPPLYYFLASRFYLLANPFDLLTRVFITRFFSIFAATATILLTYQIGKLVFKKEILALSLGVLVSFQPMFTFVGSGISSDVLFNFFFTFFIYASLLVFERANFKSLAFLIISIVGGLLTKQQMLIALLLLPLVLGKAVLERLKNKKKNYLSPKTIIIFLTILLSLSLSLKYGEIRAISGFIKAGRDNTLKNLNLIDHFIWTIRHTITEVLPWYWGVFKWLGVVLPRWVNRVQMRALGLAFLGLVFWLFKLLSRTLVVILERSDRIPSGIKSKLGNFCLKNQKIARIDYQMGFLTLVSIVYFMAVTLWNWQFRKAYGFSFGIQGRYFFPTISAHMALILFGVIQLVPKKWQKYLIFLLIVWWFCLSHIGLWTVIKSYYQTWPLQTLWWQISQYKPFWFKSYWWFLWLGLYLLSLACLTVAFFKNPKKDKIGKMV